jgi:hypothetical protein
MVERSLRMREAQGSIPRTSKSGLSLVGGIKFFAFFYLQDAMRLAPATSALPA